MNHEMALLNRAVRFPGLSELNMRARRTQSIAEREQKHLYPLRTFAPSALIFTSLFQQVLEKIGVVAAFDLNGFSHHDRPCQSPRCSRESAHRPLPPRRQRRKCRARKTISWKLRRRFCGRG